MTSITLLELEEELAPALLELAERRERIAAIRQSFVATHGADGLRTASHVAAAASAADRSAWRDAAHVHHEARALEWVQMRFEDEAGALHRELASCVRAFDALAARGRDEVRETLMPAISQLELQLLEAAAGRGAGGNATTPSSSSRPPRPLEPPSSRRPLGDWELVDIFS